MKKISSVILAAVALAAFGFVSCDHDYANSDIQAGKPSSDKQVAAKGTIKFFDSDFTSLTGTSSNTELATITDAKFEWGTDATIDGSALTVTGPAKGALGDKTTVAAKFASQKGTLDGDANDAGKYAYADNDSDVAVLSFRITAVKKLTIKSASGTVYFNKSGSFVPVIMVDGADAVKGEAPNSTKDAAFDLSVGKTIEAGKTATVAVAVRMTADGLSSSASDFQLQSAFTPLSFAVEEVLE